IASVLRSTTETPAFACAAFSISTLLDWLSPTYKSCSPKLNPPGYYTGKSTDLISPWQSTNNFCACESQMHFTPSGSILGECGCERPFQSGSLVSASTTSP